MKGDDKAREARAAVMELRYRNHENELRLIADQLRSMAKEENRYFESSFLSLLSMAIEPSEYGPFGVKLTVKLQGAKGAPMKKPDYHIGEFLWEQIDVLDVDSESAFAAAKAKFGISRSKAAEELKRERATVASTPAKYEDRAAEIRAIYAHRG
jgi:hypothetical protein